MLLGLVSLAAPSAGYNAAEDAVQDFSGMGVVRNTVDAERPIYPLYMRDKRIHGLKPFQELVDAAPAGSTLRPPPGHYAGPVLLTKPLIIEGDGKVTIDAGDKGTVFRIETENAVLRGLRLTGSGESHDMEDAALEIRGHHNRAENLVIDNSLFGIDLRQANDNVVRNNRITSKPVALGIRGDAIRLWYSLRNLIEGNAIANARDVVIWYSNHNVLRGNVSRDSRYSVHFMFSQQNTVEQNRFYNNAVGIYVMYTDGVVIRNNLISHATGATGMGIGFKEASDALVEGNQLLYCATGITSDLSPFQPDSKVWMRNNKLSYNGIALLFNSERDGNEVEGNHFVGNITDVAVNGGGTASHNHWQGNQWDTYLGFDRDRDGHGDAPHEQYAYADRIWMDTPSAQFFRATPMLELLDFLERLAPFSTPDLILRDNKPRMNPRHG
jgi:nitrous oxidase accessory protein